MVRPKRFKSLVISSFYIPIEREEIIVKAKELAFREHITFSEIIVRALADYLNLHFPGNPQIPLMPLTLTQMYALERYKIRLRHLLQNVFPNKDFWRNESLKLLTTTANIKYGDDELKRLADQLFTKVRDY